MAWGSLALGIACHVLRLLAVSRAWRNIIKGAYPQARVRWRSIVASVFAGAGVNAIIPARGGDAVRVVLAKRGVEGSSYATIASTLVLLSLFDFVVATCLVMWAAVTGRLPKVLGPSFDFGWAFHNPGTFLKVIAVVLAVALVDPALVRGADRGLPAEARTGVRDPSRPARVLPTSRVLARDRLGTEARGGALFPATRSACP